MYQLRSITACALVAALAAPVAAQDAPVVLPGTPASSFCTIRGNALTATSAPLPDTVVRLRDARLGRIAGIQRTDGAGIFSFRPLDPGSYIIELLGANQTVQTASELLNVNAGDSVSAVVKLPSRLEAFAGFLGHSAPHAAALAAAAGAAGVLAAQSTNDVSPRH